jgi:c-di-GMP-binding flagellar brake protein YcgR
MEQDKNTKFIRISGEVLYKPHKSVLPPVAVMIRELRNDGVKFVTTEKLEVQTELDLAIKVTEDSDPINAVGIVIWQGHGSSKFLLDTTIRFSAISPKDESRILNFISNSADNIKAGRCHVRCPMDSLVRYSYEATPAEESVGQTADIGILGMKLYVKDDIPINAALKLTFDLPRGRGTVISKGIVAWKGGQTNEVFPVGVKFTEIEARDKKRILRYINFTITEGKSE